MEEPEKKRLGVYDLFMGNELLPKEYNEIEYSDSHLYAYKDGIWEVYQVEFSKENHKNQ